MQKVLGYFQERLANSEEPMEDITNKKERKMRTNLSVQEGKSEKILELRKKGYSYGKIKKETEYDIIFTIYRSVECL